MKPKLKSSIATTLSVAAIGMLVYAGFNAASYSPLIKPATTQATLATQLEQKAESAKPPMSHGFILATSTATPNKVVANNATQLVNTGSENILLLFLVTSVSATIWHWFIKVKRANQIYS